MPQCSKFDVQKGMPVDLTYCSRSNYLITIESYVLYIAVVIIMVAQKHSNRAYTVDHTAHQLTPPNM